MYATRAIAAGELIVTERPLLVAPGIYKSPRQRDDTIAAALERMSEDDRAAYTALSNPCDAAVPPLFAIWKTNNYDQTHDLRPVSPEMAADTQRPMTIVGKLTSRINHRCALPHELTPLSAVIATPLSKSFVRQTAAAPTRPSRGTSRRSRSS